MINQGPGVRLLMAISLILTITHLSFLVGDRIREGSAEEKTRKREDEESH